MVSTRGSTLKGVGLETSQCPLWVISGHSAEQSPCPLYPRKRAFIRAIGQSVSYPASHPLNIVFISCSELTAHLGFLEGDVDPINGSDDGDRRNEHWPSADP
jgi:hypothetical protein